jgi:hypothetical protein
MGRRRLSAQLRYPESIVGLNAADLGRNDFNQRAFAFQRSARALSVLAGIPEAFQLLQWPISGYLNAVIEKLDHQSWVLLLLDHPTTILIARTKSSLQAITPAQYWEGRIDRNRTPLDVVYYEACLNERDAVRREKYLKTRIAGVS